MPALRDSHAATRLVARGIHIHTHACTRASTDPRPRFLKTDTSTNAVTTASAAACCALEIPRENAYPATHTHTHMRARASRNYVFDGTLPLAAVLRVHHGCCVTYPGRLVLGAGVVREYKLISRCDGCEAWRRRQGSCWRIRCLWGSARRWVRGNCFRRTLLDRCLLTRRQCMFVQRAAGAAHGHVSMSAACTVRCIRWVMLRRG